MLYALHIRDFVIVEHTELNFEPGFTVFSGETGAGKSILIDALSLALGGRGDASLVREGAPRTDISAHFAADTPAVQAWLQEQALEGPDILLRRVLDRQGRSKAFINGTPTTLGQLREISALLLDIHGQHAHQSLVHARSQRDLLDTQGGHDVQTQAVRHAWDTWQQAEQALAHAQTQAQDQARALNRLEQDLAFLDELAPQTNEWDELCGRQSRLAHAQALLAGAGQAVEALDGESGSAAQALQTAQHALQPLVRHDPTLEELCRTLESARILCSETVSSLNAYADRLEPDPEALSLADARMSRLFEAARRFQVEPEALPDTHAQLHDTLASLQSGLEIAALEQHARKAEADYHNHARVLSQARKKTAERLSAEVTHAMQTLAMTGGVFQVALRKAPASAHGLESVEFRVAGHAGTEPQPLARVASGGELARISLALSVIASEAAQVPTLIFDEVDAGIGGAVAEVVGRLLQALGNRHQVLCVTHLPQVAACAAHHIQVYKSKSALGTLSAIETLTPSARVEEIARMLGGVTVTDTTRRHAREMLHMSAIDKT